MADAAPPLPTVLRWAFGLFLAGFVPWAVAVFLQDASLPASLFRALLVPAPTAAAFLGTLLALDVKGSAAAMIDRARRQRVPWVLDPRWFVRFMGALFMVGGSAMLVMVLTRPPGEI